MGILVDLAGRSGDMREGAGDDTPTVVDDVDDRDEGRGRAGEETPTVMDDGAAG